MKKEHLDFLEYILPILNDKYPDAENIQYLENEYKKENKIELKELHHLYAIYDSKYLQIMPDKTFCKITPFSKSLIERHGSLAKHIEFENKQIAERNRLEQIKKEKLYFDAKISKWKYYTFWPLFIIAIFGGGYSVFDLTERLSKSMSNQSVHIPKSKTELELSKSHILILDQRSLDSLHISKTYVDSLVSD